MIGGQLQRSYEVTWLRLLVPTALNDESRIDRQDVKTLFELYLQRFLERTTVRRFSLNKISPRRQSVVLGRGGQAPCVDRTFLSASISPSCIHVAPLYDQSLGSAFVLFHAECYASVVDEHAAAIIFAYFDQN